MKDNSRIIVGLSIFAGVIFLIRLIFIFPGILMTTDTPGMYLLLSAASLIFFGMTFFYLFRYITNKDSKALTNIELLTAVVQLVAVIFPLLSTIRGFAGFFRVSCYLGCILLLLGVVAYYRSRHRICISFLSWGIFLLLWIMGFYYGVHLDWNV